MSNLSEARWCTTCIIDQNHYLWAIGGYNNGAPIDSIEKILITSIPNATWHVNNYSLPEGLWFIKAVIYNELIYLIGGRTASAIEGIDSMMILNTQTGQVSISNDSLDYGIYRTTGAVVNGAIYIFGGYQGGVVDLTSKYILKSRTSMNVVTSSTAMEKEQHEDSEEMYDNDNPVIQTKRDTMDDNDVITGRMVVDTDQGHDDINANAGRMVVDTIGSDTNEDAMDIGND